MRGKIRVGVLMLLGAGLLASGGNLWGAAPAKGVPASPAVEPEYVPRPRGSLTFNREIAPVIFQNCSGCHRPGEVAPFSLLTYADVQKRARQIALVTERRLMPPWKAEPNDPPHEDVMRLTADQIGMLKQWAEEGAKEGDPTARPAPPKFTQGWRLGEPDLVLQPAEAYQLEAEGKDVYRNFVIPSNFTEDRWLSAIEVRPDNRVVVHHALVYFDTRGKARELDAAQPGPGYSTFGGIGFSPGGQLGGWAPGNYPRHLPDGVGMHIPRGADIVLQVHYHRSGKVETDRTRLGLYFSKKPVDKQRRVLPLLGRPLRIPAGDANYTVRASMTVPLNATLLEVMPHMHLLGKEISVTATLPDGKQLSLVRIPDWDFNWQATYAFREPVKLPRGTKIELVARYDNSANNPRNPSNPPRLVTWGEETTDEMCIAFLHYTLDHERAAQQGQRPGLLSDRLLNLFQRLQDLGKK